MLLLEKTKLFEKDKIYTVRSEPIFFNSFPSWCVISRFELFFLDPRSLIRPAHAGIIRSRQVLCPLELALEETY